MAAGEQAEGIARASTFEAAAALDLLRIGEFSTAEELHEQERHLAEIGAGLTRLCQRYETGSQSRAPSRRPARSGRGPREPRRSKPGPPTTTPTPTTKGVEHG